MKRCHQNSIIFVVIMRLLCEIPSLYAKNTSLTLKEVLSIALQDNIAIQSAKNKYKIHVLERHIDGYYWLIPSSSVNFCHSKEILNEDDDTRSHFSSIAWECQWNFKEILHNSLKRKVGRLSNHVHKLNMQIDINEKIETLIHKFYELAMVQKEKEITKKFLQIAKKTLQDIKIKHRVGDASKLAYLDAQATFYSRKEEAFTVDQNLKLKQHTLNILLNRSPHTEISVATSSSLPPRLNTIDIIKSIENNIKITMRNKEIKKEKASLQEKKWSLLPSLSFGIQKSTPLQYIYYHTLNNDDALTSSLRLGISITWDLKPLLLFSTEFQKEKTKLHNAKLALSEEYLNVELSLQNKILEYTSLFGHHTTLTKILALKKEKLALNKERYQLGAVTILELQQEEEKTKDIEIELIKTTFEIKKLEACLKNIMGKLVY